MPARPPDLTVAQIARLKPRPAPYRVAPNLYLSRTSENAASWLFRWNGKQTVGLGPLEFVPAVKAKAEADRLRAELFHGHAPTRRAAGAAPQHRVTLADACDRYVASHRGGWRSASSARAWTNTMRDYVIGTLGKKPVELIDVDDILGVLQPHWETRTTTMKQLRERLAAVLDYATVRGWRSGANPAAWKHSLDRLLPKPGKVRPVVHRPALDWHALPDLVARMKATCSVASQAARLALLTACRSAEATDATWGEFDLGDRLWTIPGSRTKNGKTHCIPLSSATLSLLDEAGANQRDAHVFPSHTIGRPIAGSTVRRLMAQLAPGATLHGCARSGFRDWAAANGVPAEWAEAQLAHSESRTVAAYKRSTLIEARRDVMERWGAFLAGRQP